MNAVKEELESVFNEIARSRMAGLPICNPALRVQVVGLREWQGRRVGVLVTPWTISLVLMPGDDAALDPLAPQEKKTWEFPSGKYEFMGVNEPALGTCQTCSLISPVIDIETQEDAVNIARQVMTALFVLKQADHERDAVSRTASPMVAPAEQKPVSRRDFLRGNFLGT
jgi:[NiFe] hydrogenase assembly HybE family chaperone